MTSSGLDPRIYHTQGEYYNHDTTDVVSINQLIPDIRFLIHVKRAERRRKRDDTRNVQIPREVKRLRDIKKQNAKGEEFNPDYNPNSQDDVVTNKKKRKKNKQMTGISSQQWEKQHPSKQLQTVVEKEGTGTDQQNEAVSRIIDKYLIIFKTKC